MAKQAKLICMWCRKIIKPGEVKIPGNCPECGAVDSLMNYEGDKDFGDMD